MLQVQNGFLINTTNIWKAVHDFDLHVPWYASTFQNASTSRILEPFSAQVFEVRPASTEHKLIWMGRRRRGPQPPALPPGPGLDVDGVVPGGERVPFEDLDDPTEVVAESAEDFAEIGPPALAAAHDDLDHGIFLECPEEQDDNEAEEKEYEEDEKPDVKEDVGNAPK